MSNNIQKVIEEGVKLGDDFSEFMSEGYGGGIDCLRCSTCDHKYRGEAQVGQLCPRCKAAKIIRTTISNVLQAIEEEVEEKLKEIDLFTGEGFVSKDMKSFGKVVVVDIVALLKSARDSVK